MAEFLAVIALWAGVGIGLAAQAPTWNTSARQLGGTSPVHYVLDLTHPATHLARVSITLASHEPQTDFVMPEFYPGENARFNFAINVQEPAAYCQAGPGAAAGDRNLPVTRTDADTWRVQNGACPRVRFEYRVYGNDLHVIYFLLDNTQASINGGSVYMYARGHIQDPVLLDVHAPEGWKVLSQLGDVNQASNLSFANYDVFLDTPLEAAPDFSVSEFTAAGKNYRIMEQTYPPAGDTTANQAKLIAGLKSIAERETSVWGADDLDTFTYFIHLNAGTATDGMEHLFGTQLTINGGLDTPAGLQATLNIAAHELFHHWNIKRVRPAALGPWNYETNNPTPSMWVAEGFSQYYGNLTMERVGLVTPEAYLQRLATSFGNSLIQPGYKLQSVRDASLAAWFGLSTYADEETNTAASVSYVTRGEQVASVLDLDIRARTHGQHSLDDALRYLWTNTYMAPKATYYLRGRGYTETDVLQALSKAAGGASYADFYRDYVAGTKPFAYDTYLAPFGLQLQCGAPASPASYTGLRVTGNRISGVDPGSPAEAAGLGVGDEVVSMNGTAVPPAAPPAPGGRAGRGGPGPFAGSQPGTAVTVQVLHHGVAATYTLTPRAPLISACKLVDLPNLSAEQKQMRDAWMK